MPCNCYTASFDDDPCELHGPDGLLVRAESAEKRVSELEAELDRLRTVIRTGGQMLGAERAALGVTAPDGCTMDYCQHDVAEQWRAGREAAEQDHPAVERVRELERALRSIQWEGRNGMGERVCPACNRTPGRGHMRECPIPAALGEETGR